jgi:hypothetical protein
VERAPEMTIDRRIMSRWNSEKENTARKARRQKRFQLQKYIKEKR